MGRAAGLVCEEILYGGRSARDKLRRRDESYGFLNGGRPALPGGVYFGISYGGSELP